MALARVPRIGAKRMALLEAYFASVSDAWTAGDGDLREAGMDAATLRSLHQARGRTDPDEEMAALQASGARAISVQDEAYPARLREIYDPPPLLFVRGEILPADDWSVAVVGTRRVSPYGRQVTAEMSHGLASNRVTIVSGLARGVDGIAHESALEAGGRTIAVQACGVDVVYPPEHKGLAQRIEEDGAVVSEHPLGTTPRADFFPRRNRIIAGLTLGTLIVEAGEGSGALHTANWANEQNREVFAVPGRITSPTSKASNALIQQGMAKLVTSVSDILVELNLQMVEQQMEMTALLPSDPTESAVLERLSADPVHVDDCVRLAGLPASTVSSTLAMLEMKGLVRQVGPMTYVRR
ncbi:MAG: DNA processing protein [Chloroflexi bacterium]|nr:MAG: DNA processing protein [Chloroflexota bacterium]